MTQTTTQTTQTQTTTLDEAGAATYLGVSRAALHKWRRVGGGPSYIRLHRMIRYLRADLDSWLESHRVAQGA